MRIWDNPVDERDEPINRGKLTYKEYLEDEKNKAKQKR